MDDVSQEVNVAVLPHGKAPPLKEAATHKVHPVHIDLHVCAGLPALFADCDYLHSPTSELVTRGGAVWTFTSMALIAELVFLGTIDKRRKATGLSLQA